jgi:hypothetical protein
MLMPKSDLSMSLVLGYNTYLTDICFALLHQLHFEIREALFALGENAKYWQPRTRLTAESWGNSVANEIKSSHPALRLIGLDERRFRESAPCNDP